MAVRERQQSLGGLPIQMDYTARDFDSIRGELLKISETLTPAWTDKQPGDIGVTILEAVAYLGDILSYNLDRTANESYLATAQTRESVVDILRLIGYELQPPSPATVTMMVRTNIDNVTLPAGFTVRTEETPFVPSLSYELLNDVQLGLAGLYSTSVDQLKVFRTFGEQSTINNNLVFVAGDTVLENMGDSDGSADQIFILRQAPICLNSDGTSSIIITVNGDVWEGKTSFIGSEPTSTHFVYRILADQTAVIKFGDGVTGAVPTINASLLATYRINGGVETNNAGVGSINGYDAVNGVTQVYNVVQPSGGSDEEDVDTAKKQGPLTLRALDRCVTLGDFEAMALKVPGGGLRAAKAKRGKSPIEVDLYIATEGDSPIPSGRWYSDIQNGFGLIGAVGRWLNQKKPVPTILNVLPPTPIQPYFEAIIYLYDNVIRQNIVYEVDSSLQNLLFSTTEDFGDGLVLSAVIQAVENTRGVDYLDALAFYRIPALRYISGNENSLDDTLVTIDDFSEQTIRATYQIVWHNFQKFSLRRDGAFVRNSDGINSVYDASAPNVIDLVNESRNLDNEPDVFEQFVLTITVGSIHLPNGGDVWEFSVDRYLDNIEAQDYEIVTAPLNDAGFLNETNFKLTFVGGI